jgi:hypothetical protein
MGQHLDPDMTCIAGATVLQHGGTCKKVYASPNYCVSLTVRAAPCIGRHGLHHVGARYQVDTPVPAITRLDVLAHCALTLHSSYRQFAYMATT